MAACEVCGNDYDLTFEVRTVSGSHTFDSIECAAQRLAPICDNCQCRILGHGLQEGDQFFCCGHCARTQGKAELADRA